MKKKTAVIGYNDVCALAWFLTAGEQRGPVIGFDGTPLVQTMPSRLPFVDLRPAFVAEKAAGLLAKLLRGETPSPRRISVAPVFVCS